MKLQKKSAHGNAMKRIIERDAVVNNTKTYLIQKLAAITA